MLNGRHDFIYPVETSQLPMFDRLGTAADQKRHVLFDTGHSQASLIAAIIERQPERRS